MIVIGQYAFFKNRPQPKSQDNKTQPTSQSAAPAAGTPLAAATLPSAKPSAPVVAKQAQAEGETIVENSVYRIVFTNRGAQVKSWILKNYKDDKGQPLELVHQDAAKQFGYPLSFFTYDPGLSAKLNSGLYVASATGNLPAPAELSFEYSDGDVVAKKTFRFADSYVIGVETSVTRAGAYIAAVPAWPCGFGDDTNPGSYGLQGTAYEISGQI